MDFINIQLNLFLRFLNGLLAEYINGNEGRTILDPFCGSGTTLIEGLLANHNVIGIDIDPLSSLISKTKVTPVNPKKLKKFLIGLFVQSEIKREGSLNLNVKQ